MSDTPLDEGLTGLTGAVGRLREAVEAERVARELNTSTQNASQLLERKSRRRSNRHIGLVLVAIAVLTLFFVSQNTARIDDIVNNRVLSRITTCLADNETAHRINAGNDAKVAILTADKAIQNEIDSLLEPIKSQPRPQDPAQAQALDDFLATFAATRVDVEKAQADADTAITAAHVADRDCSPNAVNAYYKAS